MGLDGDLLGYSGFYCRDCLGYTGVIADAAEAFMGLLGKYKFGRTAACVFPEQLGDYDRLVEMLAFMAGLRCAGICRREDQGYAVSGCEIKTCCRAKGFYACYECDEFEACEKLALVHKGLHTDSCLKNLRAIRESGLDIWLAQGKRHHYWDEAEGSA